MRYTNFFEIEMVATRVQAEANRSGIHACTNLTAVRRVLILRLEPRIQTMDGTGM